MTIFTCNSLIEFYILHIFKWYNYIIIHKCYIFALPRNNLYLSVLLKLSYNFLIILNSEKVLNCHFSLVGLGYTNLIKGQFYFPQKSNLFRCNLISRVLFIFLGLNIHLLLLNVTPLVFFLVSSPHFSKLPTFFYDHGTAVRWLSGIILKSCWRENGGPRRIFRMRR